MGIPLTDYSILKALSDGLEKEKRGFRNSYEMDFALEALQEYSVFAFIIHDPNVHTDFHAFLDSHFEMLHYQSGQHLAFFGLVDSPQKFCLEGNRPFYTDIRTAVHNHESIKIDKRQLSYSAFTIANALDIDYDLLPAIVVTNDLRLNSFKYYKTCKEKIEIQMNRLIAISNRLGIYKSRDQSDLKETQQDLYSLLDKHELNLCNGEGSTQLFDSMARALSNTMAVLIESEESMDNRLKRRFTSDTRKQNSITLHQLLKSLSLLKNELVTYKHELGDLEEHPNDKLIENLSIQLASYLNLLNKKKNHTTHFPIQTEWLEPKSSLLLQTGIDVGHYLSRGETEQEFSAGAICLAKMFEYELNCSLVHMVRKEHSINLPRYFNEYQPNTNAYINTGNGYQVNVNNHKGSTWLPPELGKTKNIARHYFTDKHWKLSGIQNKYTFLSECDNIHAIRNKAAHTDAVKKDEYIQLSASLMKLSEQKVFENLYKLKEQYKPKNLYSTN
ncbi:hypothetical protein [Neobacillus drentensis]|uniref:hypothetical protein n=1 Tax=Neobacillus drentensis TaxID=220684 RepID=UPI003000D2CD